MKSLAVMKPGELKIVDISMPVIDSCSALVRILASGICGSDMKIVHGTFKDIQDYPCLLGHEAVGVVEEVGKDVEQYKVGDMVLLPYHGDGDLGGYASFWGAFSEYGTCHDWRAMAKNGKGPGTPDFMDFYYTQKVIPRNFDPVASVMIITLREVLAASKHFGLQANQSIVIFGAGPVGLAFTKFAKIFGLGPVIVVDVVDEKIKEAIKKGADYAFNSNKVDIVSEIRKICKEGVDYSLDAVGFNDLILKGMELIKDNGRILTYGVSPKLEMNLSWKNAPYNWSVDFFQFPIKYQEGAVHEQLINWIQMGMIDPNDYISHVFDFHDVYKGFDIVENKIPAKKIVIKYS
jgi:threonine dehydrogenase-like Zn-dependent dehydrogenase